MKRVGVSYFVAGLLVLALSALPALRASAAEAPVGTILNAGNYDQYKDMTFEGHRIGDMISPSYQQLIKTYGMTMQLAPSKPFDVDQRTIKYTEQYAPQVTLDAEKPAVNGYVAGIPFPTVRQDDPHGALKVMYNIVYSAFLGDLLFWPTQVFLMTNENGYERAIIYRFSLYQMIGRRSEGPGNHTEGDGSIRSLTTLMAIQPFDVRGLGTFAVRYVDGRYDDVYAYLRAVRRWRRLSGSAWYDPIQGSDILNDESSNAFNADPSWYDKFTILGRKTMLFQETEQEVYYIEGQTDLSASYPFLDLQTPPYWNVKDPKEYWRPRDVWVIEATPPEGHPMSKRILYVDTNVYIPLAYHVENDDRAGNLWHIYNNSVNRMLTDDGYPTLNPQYARVIDLVNLSATQLPGGSGRHVNMPGVTADDFNLQALTRILQ